MNSPLSKKMFPASLLLEGRRCLVVGGGRVAARKTAKLLEGGAETTVIASTVRNQIKDMKNVQWLERPFDERDLHDTYLVIVATNDDALNRRILECCHKKGILCSAADHSWVDGDFTMPASFSDDGLTVAISTGGRACRRARLLREDLSRHVQFMDNLDLFMLGVNSQTAGFEALERCKAAAPDLEEFIFCIRGVHEFLVLNTCNRFEVIGLVSGRTGVMRLIRNTFGFADELTTVHGMAAFRRFAELAAGLRSGIIGETRIVAQIKESLAIAQQNSWAGSFLQSWTDQTLRISKEIRQAVEPHTPPTEIEDLVARFVSDTGSPHAQPGRMLIVGRGDIGKGLAEKFPTAGLINGRDDRKLRSELPNAETVICATGNPDFVINESHRQHLRADTRLIDLSMPRNIDPALPGVIGLSELRSTVTPAEAEMFLSKAAEIIENYTDEYQQLVRLEKTTP